MEGTMVAEPLFWNPEVDEVFWPAVKPERRTLDEQKEKTIVRENNNKIEDSGRRKQTIPQSNVVGGTRGGQVPGGDDACAIQVDGHSSDGLGSSVGHINIIAYRVSEKIRMEKAKEEI
jgi:hypothetical protein